MALRTGAHAVILDGDVAALAGDGGQSPLLGNGPRPPFTHMIGSER